MVVSVAFKELLENRSSGTVVSATLDPYCQENLPPVAPVAVIITVSSAQKVSFDELESIEITGSATTV